MSRLQKVRERAWIRATIASNIIRDFEDTLDYVTDDLEAADALGAALDNLVEELSAAGFSSSKIDSYEAKLHNMFNDYLVANGYK